MQEVADQDGSQGEHDCDLNGALERLGGDRDLLKELISFFVEDSVVLQSRLTDAIQSSDAKAIESAAHALKGLCLNFGAAQAIEAARTVEEHARAGKVSEARSAALQLHDAVTLLSRALQKPA